MRHTSIRNAAVAGAFFATCSSLLCESVNDVTMAISADIAKRLNELRSQLEYIDGKMASTINDETHKFLSFQRDTSRAELEALH